MWQDYIVSSTSESDVLQEYLQYFGLAFCALHAAVHKHCEIR